MEQNTETTSDQTWTSNKAKETLEINKFSVSLTGDKQSARYILKVQTLVLFTQTCNREFNFLALFKNVTNPPTRICSSRVWTEYWSGNLRGRAIIHRQCGDAVRCELVAAGRQVWCELLEEFKYESIRLTLWICSWNIQRRAEMEITATIFSCRTFLEFWVQSEDGVEPTRSVCC